MSVLSFEGGECDSSSFVAAHAGETPTTVERPREPTAYDRLIERIAERNGMDLDGVGYVRVGAFLLVPIGDLTILDAAQLMHGDLEPKPVGRIYLDCGLALGSREESSS